MTTTMALIQRDRSDPRVSLADVRRVLVEEFGLSWQKDPVVAAYEAAHGHPQEDASHAYGFTMSSKNRIFRCYSHHRGVVIHHDGDAEAMLICTRLASAFEADVIWIDGE